MNSAFQLTKLIIAYPTHPRSLAVTSKAFLLDKFRFSTRQVEYCIFHPSKIAGNGDGDGKGDCNGDGKGKSNIDGNVHSDGNSNGP
jgi:hypothetical protein